MKKVAFVVPRMGIGGVEHSLLGLLQYAPADLDITLILFSVDGELMPQIPSDIHIKHAQDVGKSESLRVAVSTGLKKIGLNKIFKFFKLIYHKLGPLLIKQQSNGDFDVIVAYCDGLATWYAAKSLQAPKKIAFVHTDFLQAGYNAETERGVYKEFQQIFFGAQKAQAHFLQLLPEYASKTALLPNCVDAKNIRRLAQEPCDFLGAAEDVINIITVGRLSHEKGVNKIPEILSFAKRDKLKIHWYLVGEGPEANNVQTTAQRLGVAKYITLLGLQLNPYQYMAQCDIYVQPSNYEGYCIALAEALALGLPCVACDFAGADEQIIDKVNGFIADLDAESIYTKLKPLIVNKDMWQEMKYNITNQVCKFQENLFQQWWERL